MIYAEDTVLVAEIPEDLQTLVTELVEFSEEYGLSLNITKTKIMMTSK